MDLLTPDELSKLDLVCKRLAFASAAYRIAEAGWSGSYGFEGGRYFLHVTRGEEIRLIDCDSFPAMVAALIELEPENATLVWRPPPGKPVTTMDYKLPVEPEKPSTESDAD